MTAEVRARTLTGRTQVSEDGRRLVDGVPFGRPYLRHPNRPAVRIPPRKRQRLDDADEEPEVPGLLAGSDEILELQEDIVDDSTCRNTTAGSEKPSQKRRASKRVRFHAPELDLDIDDEDSEEDDADFAPDEETGHVEMDEDSSDDSDSDADDDSDSDSDSDAKTKPDASSGSDTSSSGSDSDDTSSDSDASSPPEVRSSKGVLRAPNPVSLNLAEHVVPGHGRSATRSRNSRRTRTNRLRRLKDAGKLPQDADLKALDEYEATQVSQATSDLEPSKPFSTPEGKRKRVDDDEATADVADGEEDATELEQRKQELMARFGDERVSTLVQVPEASPQPEALQHPASPQVDEVEEQPAKIETSKRRLRPDTSAISRILARQAIVCIPHKYQLYLTLTKT
jgi:hypothetical protein